MVINENDNAFIHITDLHEGYLACDSCINVSQWACSVAVCGGFSKIHLSPAQILSLARTTQTSVFVPISVVTHFKMPTTSLKLQNAHCDGFLRRKDCCFFAALHMSQMVFPCTAAATFRPGRGDDVWSSGACSAAEEHIPGVDVDWPLRLMLTNVWYRLHGSAWFLMVSAWCKLYSVSGDPSYILWTSVLHLFLTARQNNVYWGVLVNACIVCVLQELLGCPARSGSPTLLGNLLGSSEGPTTSAPLHGLLHKGPSPPLFPQRAPSPDYFNSRLQSSAGKFVQVQVYNLCKEL